LQTLRAIRASQGGTLGAAALTGRTTIEDHAQSAEAGFEMHLVKPIAPHRLVAAVAKLGRR
jgi:DNA-binding response OmpR family regulator